MKKIIFAIFAILCLSFNLKAEDKPKIDVTKEKGLAHYDDNDNFIRNTYNYVYSYQHSNGTYYVTCKDPGYATCTLFYDGKIVEIKVPSINNPEINYEFDAVLINEIADDILSEIDNGCFQRGELSGNKTKKIGMYDLSGKFHYVNFLAAYKLNELGEGNILFYINVIE